jgi:hypothetical protein
MRTTGPTCYYRHDIGHVPVAIGSELPLLSPAVLSPGSVPAGVQFSGPTVADPDARGVRIAHAPP